ncbi:uncharacterized protein LOC123312970 [Coccinella septempunctata]|uniref:uncharacterized protein LOC123312970 n=1 Tax=Coccinella septempunctata TaxID=41139 RepID=UPI001D08465C|nr:uncharacterized protein LOC123312970 [Coccinella septempunctata]
MNLPELKLKQDCPTIWNSAFEILERIYKIKDAVISTLAIGNPDINKIELNEWSLIEHSLKIYEIFYGITKEVSAEKYVTFPKIILFVKVMSDHVQKIQNSEANNIAEIYDLLKSLQNGIGERFEDVDFNELRTQATFLDPRFKKYGFTNESRFQATLKLIRQKIATFNIDNNEESVPPERAESESSSTSIVWSCFDEKSKEHLEIRSSSAAAIIETDKFLSEPLQKRTENPLKWWKERKHCATWQLLFLENGFCQKQK